jgi:hypothetical protein
VTQGASEYRLEVSNHLEWNSSIPQDGSEFDCSTILSGNFVEGTDAQAIDDSFYLQCAVNPYRIDGGYSNELSIANVSQALFDQMLNGNAGLTLYNTSFNINCTGEL